jgi:hypothetical protein
MMSIRSTDAPIEEARIVQDSTAEYDAFGPWVLPVSSPAQVPPVFRAHPIDFTRAHDVLKVPRVVARRDVTPKSHLYDQLLVLEQHGIEVLTRTGHRFVVQRIAADAVVAVDSGAALLDGWFRVLGLDGTCIEVPFNGSSLSTITQFADRLLERRNGDPAAAASGTSPELDQRTLGVPDLGLVNAYNSLTLRRPGLEVTAAYPGRVPVSQQSRVRRLLRGTPHLSGAVVAGDGYDALVSTRSEWVQYSRNPDLSTRRIVLRRAHVTAVEQSPHPFLDGTVDLTVHGGGARVHLTVPAEAATAVAAPMATPAAHRM